jgi:hypothetical protein
MGGAPAAQPAQAPTQGGLSIQQLMQAASNPWLNEGQRSVVNMMLEQEIRRADPSTQLDMDFRRAQIEKLNREAEQGGRDGTHGTPFYTMDSEGNLHVNFASKSGDKLIRAEAGSGERVLGPYDTSLERASGSAAGKKRGEAEFDLPRVEQNAAHTLGILERMKTHKGREGSTGFIQGILPSRTSDQVDFQSLVDQTQGQAFLQAFETLKGGGQITEIEGQKATDAISRLRNQRLSDADYLRAISDLEEVVNAGLARARQQAGARSPSAPAQSGNRLRFNPETGELE